MSATVLDWPTTEACAFGAGNKNIENRIKNMGRRMKNENIEYGIWNKGLSTPAIDFLFERSIIGLITNGEAASRGSVLARLSLFIFKPFFQIVHVS